MADGSIDLNVKPTEDISVREVFGIDSDMKVYTDGLRARKTDPEHIKRIEANIAQMKEWAAEGK